ncbi:MAG: lysylphosphatidylglycerol synthase domain-containing protein [Nitrospiria bacterium]
MSLLAGFLVLALILWLLHRQLAAYRLADVIRDLRHLPPDRLAAALALTGLSYFTLTGYDWMALRFLGRGLPYRRVALAAFTAYAVSHTVGFDALSGTGVRYRLYTAWGVSAFNVTKIMAFNGATFWLGFLTMAGTVFFAAPNIIPDSVVLPFQSTRPLGALFLSAVAAYLILTVRRHTPLKIRDWEFTLPPPATAGAQLALACCDIALAAAVLYVLLPAGTAGSYPAFLAVFLAAQLTGILTHVPGGVGVFETIVVVLLSPDAPAPAILASLVAYRAIYYLLPLGLAAVLLGTREIVVRRGPLTRESIPSPSEQKESPRFRV